MTRVFTILVGLALWAITNPVRADVFVLKSGGRIEGDLVASDDPALDKFYLVATVSGGKIRLAKSQVEQVTRKTEAERYYERSLPTIEDNLESHEKVAEWCMKNNLKQQRAYHLEQILRHDPNHEIARRGLGYSRVEDRWVKTDEWNLSQGYVRTSGGWQLRQAILLDEAKEKVELAEKKWRSDVKRWRGWMNGRREAEARANFDAIQDPLASMGLAEILEKETDHLMKKRLIEILGRLNAPIGQTALMELALQDLSRTTRSQCLDELSANGSRRAVFYFIRMLDPKKNSDNEKINRAGTALGRMKDPDAVMPLIEALVTEHREATGSSGGTGLSASFGNGGANGLSSGGPKVVSRPVQNERVMYALQSLTGERLGYEKEKWKQYYIQQHTPANVELRRDN